MGTLSRSSSHLGLSRARPGDPAGVPDVARASLRSVACWLGRAEDPPRAQSYKKPWRLPRTASLCLRGDHFWGRLLQPDGGPSALTAGYARRSPWAQAMRSAHPRSEGPDDRTQMPRGQTHATERTAGAPPLGGATAQRQPSLSLTPRLATLLPGAGRGCQAAMAPPAGEAPACASPWLPPGSRRLDSSSFSLAV